MTPCIDGETLAAWSSGGLRPAEAANVERHLSDCARCQAMAAVFIRSEPAAVPSGMWWQRWQLRWLVPLATAGLVAAVWVAIPNRDATVRERIAVQSEGPSEPDRSQAPTTSPGAGAAATLPAPQEAVERFQRSPDLKVEPPTARGDESRRAAREERAADAAATSVTGQASPAQPATPPTQPRVLQETAAVASNSPPATMRSLVLEISSPNAAERWRIVAGRVEHSTTGGTSWDAVNVPANLIVTGHSPSPNLVWLVGRQGAIFVATNGVTFERVPFPEAVDLARVVAVDGRQATVTTVDGRTFQTADRGANWSVQEIPNAPF